MVGTPVLVWRRLSSQSNSRVNVIRNKQAWSAKCFVRWKRRWIVGAGGWQPDALALQHLSLIIVQPLCKLSKLSSSYVLQCVLASRIKVREKSRKCNRLCWQRRRRSFCATRPLLFILSSSFVCLHDDVVRVIDPLFFRANRCTRTENVARMTGTRCSNRSVKRLPVSTHSPTLHEIELRSVFFFKTYTLALSFFQNQFLMDSLGDSITTTPL